MNTSKTRKTPPPTQAETQNWFARMWGKFKAWIQRLASKFANAFRAKERDEEGRITNQSWFGKYIGAPIMRVLGWIGKGLIWVAQFLLTLLILAAAFIAALLFAILVVVTLAVYVVLLVAYRIILGIGLILITPFAAYNDREASDAKWELYWKSWNPKFWFSGDLENVPVFEQWYEDIKSEYFSGGEFDWEKVDFTNGSNFAGAAA